MEQYSAQRGIRLYIAITLASLAFALGGYAKIWEYKQPRQEIKNAVVREIRPYYYRSELHWSFSGNRIYIKGENKPIDFSSDRWDNTVKEGDLVDLVVRRSFPLFGDELDGMHIDDNK